MADDLNKRLASVEAFNAGREMALLPSRAMASGAKTQPGNVAGKKDPQKQPALPKVAPNPKVPDNTKTIRLSPAQLWRQFQRDPVSSQIQLKRLQVSGDAYSGNKPTAQGAWMVSFDASTPSAGGRTESFRETQQRIQEAAMRAPKTITFLFPSPVPINRQAIIEGDFAEFTPDGDGGVLYFVNCRVVQ